jgi:glutathione synthase
MNQLKHILLIDPIEKLNTKKDSSLLLAASLKVRGHQVQLMFAEDLYWQNKGGISLQTYSFEAAIADNFYLKDFRLGKAGNCNIDEKIVIHMRLDPPFDSRYLRVLWLLGALQSKGAKVINRPEGIARFNEKITALEHHSSLPSFVGSGRGALDNYLNQIDHPSEFVIIKPLDMFQGYGVVKVPWDRNTILSTFELELKKSGGPLIVQPYAKKVETGETRAVYFKSNHLGSILKTPPKGQFLANIAQGAAYHKVTLTALQHQHCLEICQSLAPYGVDWIAFDLLGDAVSEVNVTCPGLLVEVSSALERNLANDLIDQF